MLQKKSDKIVVYIGIYLNVRKMDYAPAKIADLFFSHQNFYFYVTQLKTMN